MSACLIFAAGSFYGVPAVPAEGDVVIAADAGYKYCLEAGIKPDILMGDFDSMPVPATDCRLERFPVEKDDTDTMLAIRRGLELGCTEFHIYGGTGGERLDHTIANLQALVFLSVRGARGYLYDSRYVWTAITNSSLILAGRDGDSVFSVFCFGPDAKGVTITGAKYNVYNADVSASFPVGVSNHFTDEAAEISVADGTLVIGWEAPGEEE